MGEGPLTDDAPSQNTYVAAYLISMLVMGIIVYKYW